MESKKVYIILSIVLIILFFIFLIFFTSPLSKFFNKPKGQVIQSEESITASSLSNKNNLALLNSSEVRYFSIPLGSDSTLLKIEKNFYADSNFSIDYSDQIVSLSINANFNLDADNLNSFVKIILIDNLGKEYLIFESSSLIYSRNSIKTENICEETCNLPNIIPKTIVIEMEDSSVYLNSINIQKKDAESEELLLDKATYARNQEQIKINKLEETLEQKGLKWTAGETAVSSKSYAEKRILFGAESGEKMPNTYGFEYYKGGVFEIPSGDSQTNPDNNPITGNVVYDTTNLADLPLSWDWRNVNGENWITSIKNQGWTSNCWAFAQIGAFESQINLYYNTHLDVDLSEQELVDTRSVFGNEYIWRTNWTLPLTPPKECDLPTWSGQSFCLISKEGIADEYCDTSPYRSQANLSFLCEDYKNRSWKNYNFTEYNIIGAEDLKQILINKGPIPVSIYSWSHEMVLIGYEVDPLDNKTIWIFKNSWGQDWGESGYAKIKVPFSDLYNLGGLPIGPYTPPLDKTYLPINFDGMIKCFDKDIDSYCNWGITDSGEDENWRIENCPQSCWNHSRKDCDDSNGDIGSFETGYCESSISSLIKINCTDSDGGLDYYKKGFSKDSKSNRQDICSSKYRVLEWFCNSSDLLQQTYGDCPYGCDDGACMNVNDTDANNQTLNLTRDVNQTTICVDSDGGLNYTIWGMVTDIYTGQVGTDACCQNNQCYAYGAYPQLEEWYCQDGEMKFVIYNCSMGCKDGICL